MSIATETLKIGLCIYMLLLHLLIISYERAGMESFLEQHFTVMQFNVYY